MADSNKPELSVVIPTLGRPCVVRTLLSLMALREFQQLEILLVGKIPDMPVAERVRALAAQHPQIRQIPLTFATGDSSEKKNAGAREARSDLVAFLDDDVVVAADWVAKVREPFTQPEVGLVSGPSLVPADISPAARLAGMALSSAAAGYVADRYLRKAAAPREVKWSQIIGCNMVYRKSAWLAIGGFDPQFWPGEEMLAAYRAAQRGYRIVFHPQACVDHYPRTSPVGFIRQMFGYGATRIRLIRAGVALEPLTLVPGALLLALAVLIPGALVWRWAAFLLLLLAGAYALLAVGSTVMKVITTRRAVDLLLLGYIPLMHLGYGAGEWWELLCPNRDLSAPRG